MHEPKSQLPGGLLILSRKNGEILEAPEFFRRALFLDQRRIPSIFHLFNPEDSPHLTLTRVFRHPYGSTEFHLTVGGLLGKAQGFRYWSVGDGGKELAYYLVDDSSLIQTQDWAFRRLRREILQDMQDSLSSHFKNRMATVQVLSDMVRDAPHMASEASPRLANAVDELRGALNRVLTGIDDIESPKDYEDSPVRLSDMPSVIPTWGHQGVRVRCSLQNVNSSTLIPASVIERVLLPVVENAIDASEPGAEVEVIVAEAEEGFAHIEVIDKGEGMTARVLGRAEDPFFTTRTGHLGLGLAHAREALRDAGGQWSFTSEVRSGTRVNLILPVRSASQLFR